MKNEEVRKRLPRTRRNNKNQLFRKYRKRRSDIALSLPVFVLIKDITQTLHIDGRGLYKWRISLKSDSLSKKLNKGEKQNEKTNHKLTAGVCPASGHDADNTRGKSRVLTGTHCDRHH